MRRLIPRGLTGRLIALLLLALVASHLVAFLIFLDERHLAVETTHREQILSSAASIALLLKETPAPLHERIVESATTANLRFWLSPESALEVSTPSRREQRIAQRLARHVGGEARDVRVRILERPGAWFGLWPGHGAGGSRPSDWHALGDQERDHWHDHMRGHRKRRPLALSISIQSAAGPWLNVATVAPPPPGGWAWPSLVSLVVMAVAIAAIVVLMVRRIAGPLKRLAAASDSLGRGETMEPLPEEGPEEVRLTTRAFNRMSARLQRFVQDRTRMLAAISHDLRTPITTLRLRAELIDDEETRAKMLDTLEEMQRMAEATLAFAREDAAQEDTRTVDLAALVGSLCDDLADLGQDVAFEESDRLPLPCRPAGLKRAARNLIENAVLYGKRARVRLEDNGDAVALTIEDDGPGLPQDVMEQVFEPFFRLEESRSRDSGGIGLGMAIARSIIRGHGGEILLANRDRGGLRVLVRLPKVSGQTG